MDTRMLMIPLTPILADGSGIISVIGWSLVLIVLLLAGFFAVSKLRHWLQNDEPAVSIGFTLSDLRQLHREGKMTDEEYEKARSKMMAGAKAMTSKLPDPLARNRRNPADRGTPPNAPPSNPPTTGNPDDDNRAY